MLSMAVIIVTFITIALGAAYLFERFKKRTH